MGEVKRRRPWEEQPKSEENKFFSQFLNQMIICIVIGIGVLIILNTNESVKWRNIIKQEITRNIEMQTIYALIEETKETLDSYVK